jgi:hypothetical protein
MADKLPTPALLEKLLSTCYQASLLYDEGRPVRFRLILREPEDFQNPPSSGAGLYVLPFARALPLTPNELRRLSPASPLERSLIGVRRAGTGYEIWSLVHSGEQWLRALQGSRRAFPPLPASLVISVAAPGHLAVAKGSVTVVRLLAGKLATPEPGVLELSEVGPTRNAPEQILFALFQQVRKAEGEGWARINLSFIKRFRRLIALRIVSAVRHLQHGGTILILPPQLAANPRRYGKALHIKYAFEGESRGRLRELCVGLLASLAAECGRRLGPAHLVTWKDYLSSSDPKVAGYDETINELARQIACLSSVDGAVVIGQPLDLLGFGAEISGNLEPVPFVNRALSARLFRTEVESALNVGTRHRSAYRFCRALRGTSGLVVSQDGAVRFIACVRGKVVYWENLSSGALNI